MAFLCPCFLPCYRCCLPLIVVISAGTQINCLAVIKNIQYIIHAYFVTLQHSVFGLLEIVDDFRGVQLTY
jgi:hypothetical protein